jgi:hypothetical protein
MGAGALLTDVQMSVDTQSPPEPNMPESNKSLSTETDKQLQSTPGSLSTTCQWGLTDPGGHLRHVSQSSAYFALCSLDTYVAPPSD